MRTGCGLGQGTAGAAVSGMAGDSAGSEQGPRGDRPSERKAQAHGGGKGKCPALAGERGVRMGSVRLKKKIELNYRKGTTAHDCSECNHFVDEFEVHGINGEVLRVEPRCEIMGVNNGRAYRINPKSICDAHDNSIHLKRLRGY